MERRAAYQQTEDVHNTVGGDVYAFQHTTHRAAPTDASSRVFSTCSPGDEVFLFWPEGEKVNEGRRYGGGALGSRVKAEQSGGCHGKFDVKENIKNPHEQVLTGRLCRVLPNTHHTL